jgi:hypothetical protein
MDLGCGGPGTPSGLAITLAGQPVRLSGEFPGAAAMLRSSTYLVAQAQKVIPRTFPLTIPDGFMPVTATRPGTGPADRAGAR